MVLLKRYRYFADALAAPRIVIVHHLMTLATPAFFLRAHKRFDASTLFFLEGSLLGPDCTVFVKTF